MNKFELHLYLVNGMFSTNFRLQWLALISKTFCALNLCIFPIRNILFRKTFIYLLSKMRIYGQHKWVKVQSIQRCVYVCVLVSAFVLKLLHIQIDIFHFCSLQICIDTCFFRAFEQKKKTIISMHFIIAFICLLPQ